ncbi:MAG: type 1 glutamine amidotransferase [Candidatus Omnitrophica bacterium]|nr:type 1 glutamine amidotransferase [Candidatus Omnitrophota bacterium]
MEACKKILVLKHIEVEGPGTFGDFLDMKKIPWETVELYRRDRLPKNPKDYGAVVVLGGPMNVYEEDRHPFLRQEDFFIKECLGLKIPYLGFCLGSQLLAKAAGAKVIASPVKEIGWYRVDLTDEVRKDVIFEGSLPSINVFHWHSDMFNIPERGILLATGSGCPHQAFKVGDNAYGLQFHLEVTDKDIKEWYLRYAGSEPSGNNAGLESMLKGYLSQKTAFHSQAERIYKNFLTVANAGPG